MKNNFLYAVAAIDNNRAIGFENNLLHHSEKDLQYFKDLTIGKTVVMGGNTFRSLPGQKPLKNRINIILSNSIISTDKNMHVVNNLKSLHEIIDEYLKYSDVFIIGGEMLYNEFKDEFDGLYITHICTEFDKADTYFPDIIDNNVDKKVTWMHRTFLSTWNEKINGKDVCMRFTKYYTRLKGGIKNE